MKTHGIEAALERSSLTSQLSTEQRAFLASCTKNVRHAAGEVFFQEGDPSETLFIVRQGSVALESHLPGRGAVSVETLEEGEVLGWSVLFPPHTWHLTARAREPTVSFAVDGPCLRNKLEQDPGFAYPFTKLLLFQVHRRLERARLQQLDAYKAEL
jgi:CRP-like cAMP-binding protein